MWGLFLSSYKFLFTSYNKCIYLFEVLSVSSVSKYSATGAMPTLRWTSLLLPLLFTMGSRALVPPVFQPPVPRESADVETPVPALVVVPKPTPLPNGTDGSGGMLEGVLHAVEQEGVRLAGFDFEDVEIPLILAIFFFGVGVLKIGIWRVHTQDQFKQTTVVSYTYCGDSLIRMLIFCSLPEMDLHQPLHSRIVVSTEATTDQW